jgi:hypothetical protein
VERATVAVGPGNRGGPAVLKKKEKKIGGREEEEWAGGFNCAGRTWWAAGREDGPRDGLDRYGCFVLFSFLFFFNT